MWMEFRRLCETQVLPALDFKRAIVPNVQMSKYAWMSIKSVTKPGTKKVQFGDSVSKQM